MNYGKGLKKVLEVEKEEKLIIYSFGFDCQNIIFFLSFINYIFYKLQKAINLKILSKNS